MFTAWPALFPHQTSHQHLLLDVQKGTDLDILIFQALCFRFVCTWQAVPAWWAAGRRGLSGSSCWSPGSAVTSFPTSDSVASCIRVAIP